MNPIQRRTFIQQATFGLALASSMKPISSSLRSADSVRRMTINLVPGAIGVKADQKECIRLAHKHGFESVGVDAGTISHLDSAELAD